MSTVTEILNERPHDAYASAKYVVEIVGETEKFKPLAEEPSKFPPVDASHHFIPPTTVDAVKTELFPWQIAKGKAFTFVGSAIVPGVTITMTDVLKVLKQLPLYASA